MTVPVAVRQSKPVGERRFVSFLAGFALALGGLFQLHNADAFGHLAQGRDIAQRGHVPTLDPFSIWKDTPQPWNNYEWAYDLLSWWVYDLGGPNALIAAKCLVLFAIGWVLVLLAARLSGESRYAIWLTLLLLVFVIPAARFRLVVRPQILGLLFPALLLIGLNRIYRYKSGDRWTWVLVFALGLMHVLWVNSHGSHLLGLLIGGLYAAFAFLTPAFAPAATLVVLQVLASGCSPFGFDIVRDAVAHVFQPEFRALVTEWEPWSPKYPVYWLLAPVVQSLLLLVAVRPLVRSGRSGAAGAVFCLVLTLMTFRSIRFTAHDLLLTSPFIAFGLSVHIKSAFTPQVRAFLASLVALAAVYASWMSPRLPPLVPFGLGVDEKRVPWSSYGYIRDHVPNPVIFADLPSAWTAIFALPDAKVLIDGRVPFYGAEFTTQATLATTDPATFRALVEPTKVDTVIIDQLMSPNRPVVQTLTASDEWSLIHLEDQHAVFVRGRSSPVGFELLKPGYDPLVLLGRNVDPQAVKRELKRLGLHKNSAAYRAFVHAILLLRPYARDEGRAGLRMPGTKSEKGDFALAFALLGEVHERFRGIATIEVTRSLLALGLCGIDEAKEALSWAHYEASDRTKAIMRLEIQLREGKVEQAKETMARWMKDPDKAADPWVQAIAADLETGVPESPCK